MALLTAACMTARDATFNVATYNLRLLNDGDTKAGNGWQQREPVVAKLIQFHDFDIFGTQEGFKSQLEDLKRDMDNYNYIGVARDDGKEKGEHAAIFYRTDLFDVIDHGDFWLSEHPETPGLGWDAVCVRICTWGRFRHKESGKEFLFFNLHMDHIGKTARTESAKLIKSKIDALGPELPVFLTGDFNVDQNNEAYRTITGDGILTDSYTRAAMVYDLNGTFNNYKTGDYTTSRIDHIFTSPTVEVLKYGVLTDTYRSAGDNGGYQARTPSDHFPVRTTVRLR